MMMTNKKIKINGCTPIEDLITEDFGAIGTPERDEFERVYQERTPILS